MILDFEFAPAPLPRTKGAKIELNAKTPVLKTSSVVPAPADPDSAAHKMAWRMPPLSDLPAPVISGARKWGLLALQAYLALAMVGVIVKIVFLAVG